MRLFNECKVQNSTEPMFLNLTAMEILFGSAIFALERYHKKIGMNGRTAIAKHY